MTFSPDPAPAPTVTVTVPVPVATPQVTVTLQQQPPDIPHPIEVIDGLGSMLAALAAAVGLFIAIWQANKARTEADSQLKEERKLSEARLQSQLDHAAEQQRRDSLIEQIQRVSELYINQISKNIHSLDYHRFKIQLHAVPGKYLSLMKRINHIAESPESRTEAERRLAASDVPLSLPELIDQQVLDEITDNVDELLNGRHSPQVDTTPVDNS